MYNNWGPFEDISEPNTGTHSKPAYAYSENDKVDRTGSKC